MALGVEPLHVHILDPLYNIYAELQALSPRGVAISVLIVAGNRADSMVEFQNSTLFRVWIGAINRNGGARGSTTTHPHTRPII